MESTSLVANLVAFTSKFVRKSEGSHAMPFKRISILSAAMTFAALNAAGCMANVPESEEPIDNSAALESEAVSAAEQDLVKGCSAGTSLCAVEYDPDIGQISICCNTSTEMCQAGQCVAKPTRALESGIIYPKYKVLGLVYSPPGRASEVRYSSSSTFGTHTDVSNSFKSGVSVNFSSTVLDINSQFGAGSFYGTEFEQKKTTTYAYSQAASPARTTDELIPEEDAFFLWLNPKINVTEVSELNYNFVLGSKNNSPVTVWLTVREINNPALIPAWKSSLLTTANINGTDLQKIKALDPVAMGQSIDALARYKLVAQLPLHGPSYEGGDIPGNFFGIDNEQVKSNVSGFSASTSVEVLVGFELSFFGTAGLKAGGFFEWEYESKSAVINGESQGAETKLSTDTVAYNAVYNIYYDSIFRTFAFKKVPSLVGSSTISGVIADSMGQALSEEPVLVRMADGQAVYTVTDKEGRFQMLNVPEGTAEVAARQVSAKVDVQPADMPEMRLTVPSE